MAVAVVDVQVNGSNAVSQLRQINSASRTAESGIGNLRKAVVGLAGAIGAVSAAKFVFAKTAELETQTRSLQVLTGSVKQAKEIIEELQQLGAVTPFTSTELIDAAKRLQAFGVEGNRVVEVTRRLADASGATGAELQGIVTAYGQVVAKGRLQGEELLQFQERGIGLQQELQKMYKLSGQELQDALSKGRISAEAVEVAIQRLTSAGGKYANGAVAQSDTLAGRLSTLQDGVDQLARRIGQVLTPVLKSVFNQAIAVVDAVNQALAAGRGGGFARSVFGARQALNVGATSQAVDNIAKGIGQVSSQKNKAGIEQNLQALQKYQRLLQSIGPDDPNAGRAVELQGLILQKIDQNIAAQKELNKQTKTQGDLFKVPELAAPTAAKGKGKSLADQLAESVKRGGELNIQFSRQASLLKTLTEGERERFRIQFEYEDRARQISELKNSEQRVGLTIINDEIRKLELQKLGTDELRKQNKELYRRVGLNAQILGAGSGAFLTDIDLLGQQQKALDEVLKKYPQIGQAATAASDLATQGTLQMISGAQTAQQVFADFLNSIVNVLIRSAAQMIAQYIAIGVARMFAGIPAVAAAGNQYGAAAFSAPGLGSSGFGISGSLLPGRANGGSVMAGQPYIVGERGPELFTPGRSGSIAPNGSFGGSNIVVNVDATGSSVQGNEDESKRLGEVIGIAIRQELIKQKRPGGLLA